MILDGKMTQIILFLAFFSVVLLFASGSAPDSKLDDKKHVILLGASVGRDWNIPNLPERVDNSDFVFEYQHGGSCFDKGDKFREIISRPQNKPDAIFLKECAAYFPNDLTQFKNLMKRWIRECQNAGILPIPTTVVPVTRLHPFKKFLIDIGKGRNPFNYGSPFSNRRNQSIIEYNDWIKKYCKEHGLAVLDMEAAVHYSEENRCLREDLARIDGLHLNSKAYKILDQIVIPALEKVNWEVQKDNRVDPVK